MADYIVTSGELTTVANAIRAKNGTSSNLSWPDGFVSGISSGSGGGGESWQTVFEGSVTTEVEGNPWADLPEVADLSANTIKVTFNGVEYTCEKQTVSANFTFYGDDDDDWSEYPFRINITPKGSLIMTETAGTYTLKIEEPQSGGSSDFSTAEVTNSGDSEVLILLSCAINEIGPNMESLTEISLGAGRTKTAVLYKGHQYINISPSLVVTVSSGNAEIITVSDPMFGDMNFLDIKGDCTILVANAE